MADPDRTVLTESDITDPGPLRTALRNAAGDGTVSWSNVTGKPVNFAPSAHAASHAAGGADPITPSRIGAAADPTGTGKTAFVFHGSNYHNGHADDAPLGAVWIQSSTATVANGYPATLAGLLETTQGASVEYMRQMFTLAHGSEVWVRMIYGGNWSPWKRLVTADDPRLRDTGWRDITSLVISNILDPEAPGQLLIRRVGDRVILRAVILKIAQTTSKRVDLLLGSSFPLPVGFRPSAFHVQARFTQSNAITTAYDVTAWSTNSLSIHGYTSLSTNNWASGWNASHSLHGEMQWITDNDWPSSLPGSPI